MYQVMKGLKKNTNISEQARLEFLFFQGDADFMLNES